MIIKVFILLLGNTGLLKNQLIKPCNNLQLVRNFHDKKKPDFSGIYAGVAIGFLVLGTVSL